MSNNTPQRGSEVGITMLFIACVLIALVIVSLDKCNTYKHGKNLRPHTNQNWR